MEDVFVFFPRLKSERRKKRLVKNDLEKKVRKYYKRSNEIFRAKKEISLVPLKEPYQKGFVRFFTLRDDIKRSKDFEFFENLLMKINTEMYSDSRKFQKKKKRFGKRVYHPIIQCLRELTPSEFSGPKSILTDKERQYFIRVEKYSVQYNCKYVFYEFIEPWRYCLKIRPNIITHYKPLIVDLEVENAEVESFLEQEKNKKILYKKIHGGGYSYKWRPVLKQPFTKGKFFNETILATEIAERLIEKEHQLSKRNK